MISLNFILLLSVLLFFQGFFPIFIDKPAEKINIPEKIDDISLNINIIYKSDVIYTVFIVIDALRLDFISKEYTPRLWKILENTGCINTVTVESPTVTLPRIKALTAGSVSQFIDVVLNLFTSEKLQDSIIHSLVKNNKKVVFFGDDTWLKIFPNFFLRSEGTTSFFVKDFTEVDNNVTRNVNIELQNYDWDFMVLHYLGLDHIGHVYGPFSSLIPPKLAEMEDVIIEIYKTLQERDKKSLIVITGDHGMKDSGGHGGSTYPETHVPFVILGTDCDDSRFSQVDIPINLAVMLGINIPSSSIGTIKSPLHKSISREKHLLSLRYNTLMLLSKKNICIGFDLATSFHKLFLRNKEIFMYNKARELYENCSRIISNSLVKSSVSQNVNFLITALTGMLYLSIILICMIFFEKKSHIILNSSVILLYLMQFLFPNNSAIFLFVPIISLGTIFHLLHNTRLIFKNIFKIDKIIIYLLICFQPLTFFSSSYVEEEHVYWYFSLQVLLFLMLSKSLKSKFSFLALKLTSLSVAFRFIITLNQTGDKWANLPDLSDWFLKEDNYVYLQMYFLFSLLVLFVSLFKHLKTLLSKTLVVTILTLIFIFKNSEKYNTFTAQIIWIMIILNLFYSKDIFITWTLLCSLLLKPYNILLLSFCHYSSKMLKKSFEKDNDLQYFGHMILATSLYFAQGHSNSLASVDVSVGYTGLSLYNPILVFIQVLSHTYAFPILCHILVLTDTENHKAYWRIILLKQTLTIFLISTVTFIHKDHLFIWSVFAPKLFIETINTSVVCSVIWIYYILQYCYNLKTNYRKMYIVK